MTIFVDASAIVAIMTREPEAMSLTERLFDHGQRLYSPMCAWEATLAIARKRKITISEAGDAVLNFAADFGLRHVAIDARVGSAAVDAHVRYGRGNHRARLNMGDCFSYACARSNDAQLLYKGDDFSHTDLA